MLKLYCLNILDPSIIRSPLKREAYYNEIFHSRLIGLGLDQKSLKLLSSSCWCNFLKEYSSNGLFCGIDWTQEQRMEAHLRLLAELGPVWCWFSSNLLDSSDTVPRSERAARRVQEQRAKQFVTTTSFCLNCILKGSVANSRYLWSPKESWAVWNTGIPLYL